MQKSFKNFHVKQQIEKSEFDKENDEDDKKTAHLLKRRLNAFVREKEGKYAHRLANTLIKCLNCYTLSGFADYLKEEYEDDDEHLHILSTFLGQFLEDMGHDDHIISTAQNLHEENTHKQANLIISELKTKGLIDLG